MNTLVGLLKTLPANHREALTWAHDNRGETIGWPGVLESGVRLASKAKGIYKPAGWKYALSIRQSLGSPYSDVDPEYRTDGSWTYKYAQEDDPSRPGTEYTNKALEQCMLDGIPVAVFRQVSPKPNTRYQVLGTALVSRREDSFFILEGCSPTGGWADTPSTQGTDMPTSLADARKRIERSIIARQGQTAFRGALLKAFGNRCAISNCVVQDVLEAAHIVPYLGPHTNTATNGLLLRADLHTLFDRDLLWVDPQSLEIRLASSLTRTEYRVFESKGIRTPQGVSLSELRQNLLTRQSLRDDSANSSN